MVLPVFGYSDSPGSASEREAFGCPPLRSAPRSPHSCDATLSFLIFSFSVSFYYSTTVIQRPRGESSVALLGANDIVSHLSLPFANSRCLHI